MDVISVKTCGAKCRTKNGAPCKQPAMKNGRCRMHGGSFWKKEKHGNCTLRAKEARKEEHALLREMKAMSKTINEMNHERQKESK